MPEPTCATCRHLRGNTCCRFPPREGDIAIAYPAKMFCGEHAPTPAVGVPGLPELPEGWTLGHRDVASGPGGNLVFIDNGGCVQIYGWASRAPIAVVEAVIARHLDRAGGAK